MIYMDFAENTLFASFGTFADSKLLEFSDPSQLTLRINRMLGVLRYIRIGLIIILMRGGYEGGVWGRTDSYARLLY